MVHCIFCRTHAAAGNGHSESSVVGEATRLPLCPLPGAACVQQKMIVHQSVGMCSMLLRSAVVQEPQFVGVRFVRSFRNRSSRRGFVDPLRVFIVMLLFWQFRCLCAISACFAPSPSQTSGAPPRILSDNHCTSGLAGDLGNVSVLLLPVLLSTSISEIDEHTSRGHKRRDSNTTLLIGINFVFAPRVLQLGRQCCDDVGGAVFQSRNQVSSLEGFERSIST